MSQLKKIFFQQREAFNHFFEALDLASAQTVLEAFADCKGQLHFTGVGKSGLVAKKLAKTFCATGTSAHYLDPIDALHGDFGLVKKLDLVVILSKSCKSSELLPLIELLKKQKVEFMLWSCTGETRIDGAMITQVLPLKGEVCPFKKAPLTSSALQLVFGNCIAAALMHKKQFALDSYSINHSGGSIGKDLIKIKDIMIKGQHLPLAFSHETLEKKLVVLSQKRLGTLLIVDEKMQLLGIFTDGDLRRSIEVYGSDFIHMPLAELMTVKPKTISEDAFAKDALALMHEPQKQVMALPVIDKQNLIGLIHLHQIT